MLTAPWLALAAIGWSTFPHASTSARTYFVDPAFCARVLPHFREDRFLSWSSFGCLEVHATVRGSVGGTEIQE